MESSRTCTYNKLISSEPLYIWVFALPMAFEVFKTPVSCYLKRFLKVFVEKINDHMDEQCLIVLSEHLQNTKFLLT